MNLNTIKGQGITASILKQLRAEGVVSEDKNLSGSVWTQIMNLVAQDEEAKKQYSGGSEFIEGSSAEARASWKNNFIVSVNQTISFSQELWNKIVTLAKGGKLKDEEKPKKDENIDKSAPSQEVTPTTEPPKINPDNKPTPVANLKPAGIEAPEQVKLELPTTIEPLEIKVNPQNVNTPIPQIDNKPPIGLENPPVLNVPVKEEPIKDTTPIQETNPQEVTNPKKPLVNPSSEDIQANLKNLKPGESFTYIYNEEVFTSITKPIKWVRNKDNTLSELTENLVNVKAKLQWTEVNTLYQEDGKTKIKEEKANYFGGKTTTLFDNNGKLTQKNISIPFDCWSGNLVDPYYELIQEIDENFSSQELKNKKGKTILLVKDGKYYNKKGKEIPRNELREYLVLLKDKDKPTEIIQTK